MGSTGGPDESRGCGWRRDRVATVIDRAIGIAGLALALVFPVLPFMSARVNKAVVWSGCVLGLLLVGLSAGLLFMPVDAQTPPTVQQSNTGAPNINASGNGNQFYLAPSQPRVGDDSVVVGPMPLGGVGNRSTVVGPVDGSTNTIFNRGGTAIGAGASAAPTGIAIGTGASAVAPAPIVNAPGNSGIITQGQSGGTNIINRAPSPRLQDMGCSESSNSNGQYKWVCRLGIDYPGVVPRFTLVASGNDVTDFQLNSAIGVEMSYRTGQLADGRRFASVGNAGGIYTAVVVRRDNVHPVFRYSFK